jgi:hypothetical protein
MMMTSAQAFARAVAALVDEHDVTDVLAHFLVDGQRAVGATAVGLLVRSRSGDLEVLTASSHRISELEAYQAQQVDGPCADSVRTGAPVFESGANRLAARWPALASLLTAAQCQAVQAHPMRWHGQVLGAINFFYSEPVASDSDRLVVGQAFADMATLILLTPDDLGTPEIADRTRQALEARTVVEQAKGVLAYLNNVPIDEAYDLLLDMTRADGGTLSATAATVIHRAASGTQES